MIRARAVPVKQTSIRTAAYGAFHRRPTSQFRVIFQYGELVRGN
jgi:hypothetical protein